MAKSPPINVYQALIEHIFFNRYPPGSAQFEFLRSDLARAAAKMKIAPPRNLGDVIYSLRYRSELPQSILNTQPKGMEWIIEGAGRARYRFSLVRLN